MASKRTRASIPELAGVVIGAAVGLSMIVGAVYLQPGPSWLWASDACPDINTTCGMIPLGPLFATAGAVLFFGMVNRVVSRVDTDQPEAE